MATFNFEMANTVSWDIWSESEGIGWRGVISIARVGDVVICTGLTTNTDGDEIVAYGNSFASATEAIWDMRRMFSAQGNGVEVVIAEEACDRLRGAVNLD